MGMDRYLSTGAWVATPDTHPDYWADQAKRRAELKNQVTPGRLEAFQQSGGVAALAIAANTLMQSDDYILPPVVTLQLD